MAIESRKSHCRPTKAMVLAAGVGSRLGELTRDVPKPMIRVAGRPILEHNVRMLGRHGVRNLVINLHHGSAKITDYFGAGEKFGLSITYSHEPVLLGTAGAVKNVESFFDETFLVVYGDNLTTCDINRLCNAHLQHRGIATVALFQRDNPASSGVVSFGNGDRITGFIEKPSPDKVLSNWVNAGIMVLEPEVLSLIPARYPVDFGHDVFPFLLAKDYAIYGYRMTEGLWWIDTPADYQRVQEAAAEGELKLP